MKRTWKLVPFAVIAALGVLALLAGSRVPIASADVQSISLDGGGFTAGGAGREVTVVFTKDDVATTSLTARIVADVISGSASGITLTFLNCTSDSNNNNDFSDETVGNCANNTADDDPDAHEFEWGATKVAAIDGNGENQRWRIRLQLTAATCSESATIRVTASQDGSTGQTTVTCVGTGTNTPTPTVTGTITVTPSLTPTGTLGPTQMQISAAPTAVGCSGSAFVTVVLRNQAGAGVPSVPVALTASIGTVAPSSTQTGQDGGVLAVYTAPSNQGGVATITASAGGLTQSTQIQVNCALATNTPVPPPPTATPVPGIQPPATGDAGLQPDAGRSWLTYFGLALLAAAGLGGLAVARQRI